MKQMIKITLELIYNSLDSRERHNAYHVSIISCPNPCQRIASYGIDLEFRENRKVEYLQKGQHLPDIRFVQNLH